MDQEPTYEDLKKRVAELESEVSRYQIDNCTKFPEILCAILEAFRYIPACKKFEDAAKKIFEQCKKMIGARSGYVALLSENGEENEVLFLDAGGLPCDVDPDLPMPIRGLREIAYKTKEVAYDNDFFESPWMDFMPQGHVRLDNVLFAPINIEERTVGIIGIANKPEGFCKRDVDIAKIFGELAAVALTYAKSQELLRASEDHYRSLFNNVNDAVFVHKVMPDGQPGNFLYVNQAAQNILGYTEQELQSMSPWELDDPETSIKIIPEVMRQLFQKKKATFEAVQIAKNKQKIYVEVNTILTQIQDQEYILSVCRDVSQRKQHEKEIRLYMTEQYSILEKLQKLSHDQEAILDNVPAYIYFKDDKNNIIKTTKSVAEVTGLPKEKIEGRHSSEIYPEIADKYWADDLEVIATGKPKMGIIEPLPAKDGQTRWLKTDKIPYFEKGADVASGVIVFCNDITNQKKSEKELSASKERFEKIFHSTPALISISKIEDGTYLEVNDTLVQSTGYAKENMIGKTSVEIGFISRKYRNQLIQELLKKGRVQNLELTLTRYDGSSMICSYSGEIVKLDGKKRLLSMATDITDRKRQENLILKKQEELEIHSKKLEEMNTALNVLIDHRSQEKENFKNEILKQFEKLVFPYFPTTKRTKTQDELSTILSIIERNTKEILLKGDNKNLALFIGLTPMETQIAQMIKEGRTSKGIANDLKMSVHTVYFHRENIRKKLNLTKSNTNLRTYLQTQF